MPVQLWPVKESNCNPKVAGLILNRKICVGNKSTNLIGRTVFNGRRNQKNNQIQTPLNVLIFECRCAYSHWDSLFSHELWNLNDDWVHPIIARGFGDLCSLRFTVEAAARLLIHKQWLLCRGPLKDTRLEIALHYLLIYYEWNQGRSLSAVTAKIDALERR